MKNGIPLGSLRFVYSLTSLPAIAFYSAKLSLIVGSDERRERRESEIGFDSFAASVRARDTQRGR